MNAGYVFWREIERTVRHATQRVLHAGPLGILIGVAAAGATGFSLDRDWSSLAIVHLVAALVLGIALAFAVAVTTELLEHLLGRTHTARADVRAHGRTAA